MKKKFGLLGHPLGHSMSPFIHGQLFKIKNADATYNLFDVAAENLANESKNLLTLDGFNVTIPYKKEIIKYIDVLDDTAARYNSVNVVKTGRKNVGFNTDVVGFLKSIETMGASLCGKVLMLGCGGVAQMMGAETVLAKGELTVAVRNLNDGKLKTLETLWENLDGKAKINFTDINKIDGKFDVMLNATPVGMYPNIDTSPANEEVVANCSYVFDAIYNPEKTLLSQYAKKHGVKCVTGMEMLVRQAVEAQTIWNGFTYTESEIQNLITLANERL